VTAKQQQDARNRHITCRFVITKNLQAVVQQVVSSQMSANEIEEAFGAAGIVMHPVLIGNLLARRAALQQRS
jgi:hypothetical protein